MLLSKAEANDTLAIDMLNVWGHGRKAYLASNPTPGLWMLGTGRRLLERAGPGVIHNDLRACNEYRAGIESAAKVGCPALAMVGRQDLMTPPKAARGLLDALPDGRSVTLDHCGHMMMTERSDAVLDTLIDHLRPLRASAGA